MYLANAGKQKQPSSCHSDIQESINDDTDDCMTVNNENSSQSSQISNNAASYMNFLSLKEVASVADSLMRKYGVGDRDFRNPQASMHAWAPRPRPSIGVTDKDIDQIANYSQVDQPKQQPRGDLGEPWQSKQFGVTDIQPYWPPPNHYQPIGSQIGTELDGFHLNPSNQQSQHGDISDNRFNAKPHTQKCFIDQTIDNGQQRTELGQMDPQAPLFGPYNGAWA